MHRAPVRRSVRDKSSLKLHNTCAVWPGLCGMMGICAVSQRYSNICYLSKINISKRHYTIYGEKKSYIIMLYGKYDGWNDCKATSGRSPRFSSTPFSCFWSIDRPSDTAPWARCRHEWHQRVDHSERWLVQWRSCTLEDWSCKTWWDWIYVLVSYRNSWLSKTLIYILTVASPLFGKVFDKSNNGMNQPFYWIGIR